MHKTLRTLLATALLVSGAAGADEGQAMFDKLTCKTCHDPVIDQTSKNLGPSLVIVATAYYNDEEGLVKFLKGQAKPRISPETYMIMETQIAMILGDKPEDNLRTLARFILSHAPVPATDASAAAAPAALPAPVATAAETPVAIPTPTASAVDAPAAPAAPNALPTPAPAAQ